MYVCLPKIIESKIENGKIMRIMCSYSFTWVFTFSGNQWASNWKYCWKPYRK